MLLKALLLHHLLLLRCHVWHVLSCHPLLASHIHTTAHARRLPAWHPGLTHSVRPRNAHHGTGLCNMWLSGPRRATQVHHWLTHVLIGVGGHALVAHAGVHATRLRLVRGHHLVARSCRVSRELGRRRGARGSQKQTTAVAQLCLPRQAMHRVLRYQADASQHVVGGLAVRYAIAEGRNGGAKSGVE